MTRGVVDDDRPEPEVPPVVCARCFSLRHYGRVKVSGRGCAPRSMPLQSM